MPSHPIWIPSQDRVSRATMTAFRRFAAARADAEFADTPALHDWSIREPAQFWDTIWDFFEVIGDKGTRRLLDGDRMPGARFFPDARLNFAENLLRPADGADRNDDAIVFWGEDKVKRRWTWDELNRRVSELQQAMRAAGVAPGDCVAGLLPNMPEAIAAMLAATSLGAVWSSVSPDFGVRGVIDRLGQIGPKLLVTVDGYWYAGKRIAISEKLAEIALQLPSVVRIVVADYLGDAEAVALSLHDARACSLADFIAGFEPAPIAFDRLPFDHPLYIMFSSGTTGVPKCIVHRSGGVLLQHLKEIGLHCDVNPADRLFYFSTLSWMMWNWLVSGLARGATLLLYDGSPFHPHASVLFDYAEAEAMTHFGTSAKYIDALKKASLRPMRSHRLDRLRTMLSTGSPLVAESFDYVYQAIKSDLHLASISGGTDIISCFVLGDPTRPVWRGEIQGPGLGLAVDVWSDDGAPAAPGVKGELVCTKPFVVMPLGFFADTDGARYRSSYFERFPQAWCQGDFAEVTVNGGLIIHGRSDATLNPGGVRIGTAEIYAQVEAVPQVREALAIGQEHDSDVRVVLFVTLQPDAQLDDALQQAIRAQIRQGASPRHVPARIVAVADIPRTKSGKIAELAVRDVVHGREVKNVEALANPECLALFRNLEELRS
ncbi:MAG: acetoacetate--CoA ligase [Ancalomicrobiaceae bacterium]|nr:acetoacetate--CoA ligase [Ancalomicrobiaceae bacterium]